MTNTTLIDNYQTGQFMNRSNLAPKVTTAFHWGDISLVPSFTLHETYYGEGQTLLPDPPPISLAVMRELGFRAERARFFAR